MPSGVSDYKAALLPLTIACLLTAKHAFAADETADAEAADENKNTAAIEPIVVVGETTNTEITPEELEFQQANDLSDIFRHIPSVSVGGSLGIAQKFYLRGIEDTLINVTVDGAPQTGTLFHHIGRVSIEPELLQKVEVQAGAGEATAGAGALGGAVRFKTKEAWDLLAPGEQFGGYLKANYFSNDGIKGSASVFSRLGEDWGILASYVGVNRENMEDGSGNELYGTAADQNLAFAKLSGAFADDHYLSLSIERREESGEFGQRPNWPTLEEDPLFPMDGERQTLVANYGYTPNELINLEATVYHTETDLVQDIHTLRGEPGWGEYAANTRSFGFDIRNTSRIGQHTVTYGTELRDDRVKSEYLDTDVVPIWAWDPNIGSFKEEGQVWGLYIQDHWQLTEAMLLSFGLRYDNYELDQVTYDNGTDSDGFSPNLGFRYDINDRLSVTAGHARALRGKEVSDGFTLEIDPTTVSLDPDLNPERAENTELGVEYDDGNLAVTASVYYSTIDDVILDQIGGGTYYEIVGKLRTKGFELDASYLWKDLLLSASFSYNDPELNGHTVEGYEEIGLANARGNTWNLGARYFYSPQLEMGWNFTYVQALDDIETLYRAVELGWIDSTQQVDKPSYQVHDIYLRWIPFSDDSLTLDFAVLNLFDEDYRDHSSVADYNHIPDWEGVAGVKEPGRDIRLTMKYRF